MSKLAINVSSIISSLCYSIFRLEPYTTCTYNCRHCYGRWYRSVNTTNPTPQYDIVREFAKLARRLKKLKLGTIPFRMSTLIEPFQFLGREFKLSPKIMKIAFENKIPLIKYQLSLHSFLKVNGLICFGNLHRRI